MVFYILYHIPSHSTGHVPVSCTGSCNETCNVCAGTALIGDGRHIGEGQDESRFPRPSEAPFIILSQVPLFLLEYVIFGGSSLLGPNAAKAASGDESAVRIFCMTPSNIESFCFSATESKLLFSALAASRLRMFSRFSRLSSGSPSIDSIE